MSVSLKDRQVVRERAQYYCEYCKRSEEIHGREFEIDHIYPQSLEQIDVLDNLAYACHDCNQFKSDYEKYSDPLSGEMISLFNPRSQKWDEHFQWSEDKTELLGITANGRATIACLHMNTALLKKARLAWQKLGWPSI